MNVIFKSNDSLSQRFLGRENGAHEWIQKSLGNFLSEGAIVRLSLFTNGIDEAVSTLNIVDGSTHVYAKSKVSSRLGAIEEVIKKAKVQFIRNKNNKKSFDNILSYDEEELYADYSLDGYRTTEKVLALENALNKKKKSSQYQKTTDKFVNYLYLENEIERAENQLNVLYNIKENEKNSILHVDYVLLVQSIEQLKNEINSLIEQSRTMMSNSEKAYIDKVVDDELNILSLKRR